MPDWTRRHFLESGAALVAAASIPMGGSAQESPSSDGPAISQPLAQQLADRFRPMVELVDGEGINPFGEKKHLREKYFPASVEWYLKHCRLEGKNPVEKPTVHDLAKYDRWEDFGDGYRLKPKSGDVHGGIQPGTPNQWPPPCYAHLRPVYYDDGHLDIQYWFFYAHNGGLNTVDTEGGRHEGDWEHVTVRVSGWQDPTTATIDAVFFAQHGHADGYWLHNRASTPTQGHYAVVPGTSRVIVYAALHSHASYEFRGDKTRAAHLADDHHWGGLRWDPKAVVAAIDHDAFYLPWARFAGRWGTFHKSLPFDLGHGDSPPTPFWQLPWLVEKPTTFAFAEVSRAAAKGQKSRVSEDFHLGFSRNVIWKVHLPRDQAHRILFTVMADKGGTDHSRVRNATSGTRSAGSFDHKLYIGRLSYTDTSGRVHKGHAVLDALGIDRFAITAHPT